MDKLVGKNEEMGQFRDSIDVLLSYTGLWPAMKIRVFYTQKSSAGGHNRLLTNEPTRVVAVSLIGTSLGRRTYSSYPEGLPRAI